MSIAYADCLNYRIRSVAKMIYDLVPEHGGGSDYMSVVWWHQPMDDGPDLIAFELHTSYQPYRGRGVYDDMVTHHSVHSIPLEDLEPDFISEQDHLNGWSGGRHWSANDVPYIQNLTNASKGGKRSFKK